MTGHGLRAFCALATRRSKTERGLASLVLLAEARVLIEDWRRKYNSVRPHSSLGNLTLAEFAERCSTTQKAEAIFQGI